MTSTSKRLFAYFLSIIGLDRIAHATATNDTNDDKTNLSFMSESTLFVSGDGLLDEKLQTYDAWSLQTWLSGLPKTALCHILTTTAMKYPKVIQLIEQHQPRYLPPLPCCAEGDFYREMIAIKDRARSIVHSLDQGRPSEQFANQASVAQELQRVVRYCTNTLHASTHGHSLAALMGLLMIAREGLDAVPEIRKYLFGKAHLGRMLVLEMTGVLKNLKSSPTPLPWSLLLSALDPPPSLSDRHQVAWLIQLLGDVCKQMANADQTWAYLQEYDNVVAIAAHHWA
ncbi:hypothetical protein BJV82DRAFT_664175 [Fennellomyces sp. T-0311]|nr:hypothetical protein BJV82DRAFT_664175 [Fennellomyces sp. T-0311]